MKKEEIIKIFEKMGFQTKSDINFGQVIILSAEQAYTFSSITGAKYMIYQNGVTMKGRAEVFIHRSVFSNKHLIYSPGLFERDINGFITEGNSAYCLKEKYPEVFRGEKRLIIYDISNESSNIESNIYNKIVEAGENPEEYLLYKNFVSNILGESLQEYLASIYFIKKGFIVENQTPWFQQNYKYKGLTLQGGIPDFSAFNCSFSKYLYKLGIIDENTGISVNLLPVIINFRILQQREDEKNYQYKLAIGEAKTAASALPQALKQLEKYNAVNLANKLFTIIPNSKENDVFGSMYIDEEYNVICKEGENKQVDVECQQIDSEWIDIYLKMLLLGNIKFEEIKQFVDDFRKNHNLNVLKNFEAIHLLDAVQNTSNEDYYNYIRRKLWPTQVI